MAFPNVGRSAAVLIGTSEFTDPDLADLPTVEDNLRGLRDAFGLDYSFNLPPDRCRVVLNPHRPHDLFDPLDEMAKSADDFLLVYFAGHGLLEGDEGDLHLALKESRQGQPWTSVHFQDMAKLLHKTKAKTKVLLLDCCFSGRAMRFQMSSAAASPSLEQIDVAGTYVMTSASENKRSLAPDDQEYTAFTGELLDIIVNGLESPNEHLTFSHLFDEVKRRLRARSLPLPQQRNVNGATNLFVAKNRLRTLDPPSGNDEDTAATYVLRPIENSRSHAVLVGVGTYISREFYDLRCPENDVRLMRELLENEKLAGVPHVNVAELFNPESPNEILNAFADAASVAEDVLFFYYAGHALVGGDGSLRLATSASEQRRPWTSLSVTDMSAIVAGSRAEAVVLILDCCFSGRITRDMLDVGNTYILASASSAGVSGEDERNGFFTKAVHDVLVDGIQGAPVHLTPVDIHDAVRRRLVTEGRHSFFDTRLTVVDVTRIRCVVNNTSALASVSAYHPCIGGFDDPQPVALSVR